MNRNKGLIMQYFPWSDVQVKRLIKSYSDGCIPQMYLELGNKCSLNCVYCDSPNRGVEQSLLTITEIERLLDDLQKSGLCFVFICGYGEPASDIRFLHILRILSKRKLHISIFTNLQPLLHNRDMLMELIEIKPNILIKYDTNDSVVFDKILGVRGIAENIYETLEIMLNYGFVRQQDGCTNLGLSIVPTLYNVSHITEVFDYAIKIGAYPCIGELEIKGNAIKNRNDLLVPLECLNKLKDDIYRRFGIVYERPLCGGIFCGMHISSNGDCIIDYNTGLSCGWFYSKADCRSIGSIKVDNITELWKRVLNLRLQKLTHTVDELTRIPATLGLGGGSIPAKWVDDYKNSTLRLSGS